MVTDQVCQDDKQPFPHQNEDPADDRNAEISNPDDVMQAESDHETRNGDPLEKWKDELVAAKKEAENNYDRLLRVSAEFENYKKRMSREMSDLRNYANESIIREFLSVLDNLERALHSSGNGGGATDQIIEGVEMTLKEIRKIMEKHGVSTVDALEKPFDPAFHQAVMREETDAFPENTVTQMLQKGYMLHERLIRPAMVVVSAATTAASGKDETIQNEKNS